MTPVAAPVEVGQKRRWKNLNYGDWDFEVGPEWRGVVLVHDGNDDFLPVGYRVEHIAEHSEVIPDPPIEPGSRWVGKDAPEERCIVLAFQPEPERQGGFVKLAYTPSREPMGWNFAGTVGVAFRRDQEPYDEAVHGPWAAGEAEV